MNQGAFMPKEYKVFFLFFGAKIKENCLFYTIIKGDFELIDKHLNIQNNTL